MSIASREQNRTILSFLDSSRREQRLHLLYVSHYRYYPRVVCHRGKITANYGDVSSPLTQRRIRTSSTEPHLVRLVLQQCRRGA